MTSELCTCKQEASQEVSLLHQDVQFTRIVHACSDQLLFAAYQITRNKQVSEDIVQEAFLELWRQRAKIIPENPVGWLHKVVSNLSNKYLRRSFVQIRVLNTLKAEKTFFYSNVEERLTEKEHNNLLNSAFNQLPHKQQVVYHLSREKGLRRHEIAAQLNLSPNTVKEHLSRATQFIKEHIAFIAPILLLFVFNNLFFSSSSTNSSSRELYNIRKAIEKDLPDKIANQGFTDRSVSGKQLSITVIVSLIK